MKTGLLIRALIGAGIVALAGCGGGGGSDTTPTTGGGGAGGATISGTAAGGAPLIGSVTVKDSNGLIRTANIAADGKYSVDVSGMTGPFIFKATGTVGGRAISLVSAATANDVGKTINITPFTDLMVANIAGLAAEQYFNAGNPEASKLSVSELNAARDKLTARLQPILGNLGIEAGFDLLRTAFSANHTGFDRVMDVVKVEVNPATAQAIIKDIVSQQQITDDLASKTDASVIATPSTSLAAVVTDLQAIEAQMEKFNKLFETTVPASNNASLLALYVRTADGFIEDGGGLEYLLSTEKVLNPELVGLRFDHPVIVEYLDANKVRVSFRGTFRSETFSDVVEFRKVGGVWLNAGNQRMAEHDLAALVARYPDKSFKRSLEIWLGSGNLDIHKINMRGPGLKTSGINLVLSTQGGGTSEFKLERGEWDGTSWIRECVGGETPDTAQVSDCINFSQVSSYATYSFAYYDQNGIEIANAGGDTVKEKMNAAPMSVAEASANFGKWFAAITGITPQNASTWATGQTITMSWTKPTEAVVSSLGADVGNVSLRADFVAESATSASLGTWSGPAPSDVVRPFIWTEDLQNRKFVTLGLGTAPQ